MSLDTARSLRALALAGGTVALVLGAQRPALADRVTLKKDGRVLEGRVIDRGDFIYLEQEKGGINIPRGDVLKVEFDDTGEVVRSAEHDVVVTKDGNIIRGTVRYENGGKTVVVEIGSGKAKGIVKLRRDEIRTILERGKAETATSPAATPGEGEGEVVPVPSPAKEQKLRKDVEDALARMLSDDPEVAELARFDLVQLGIYAVPHLERASLQGGKIGATAENVLRMLKLREVITSRLEEAVPSLLRRITHPSEAQRIETIREAVLMAAEDVPPLLMRLVQTDTHPEVRAICVSQLALLRAYDQLFEILRGTDNQARLTAAIALGDDGIYVGIPLVIEALKLKEPTLRALAIRKLAEWTGDTLGFDAAASEERREVAVDRWWKWWDATGQQLAQKSMKTAKDLDNVSSADRLKARQHWTEANAVLDRLAGAQGETLSAPERRFELEKALYNLRKALEIDPTFSSARLSLAIIQLEEFGRPDEARRELELLLTRFARRDDDVARKTILYYLGRASLAEGDPARADVRFAEALREDPNYLEAILGRAEVAFDRATVSVDVAKDGQTVGPTPERRRELLEQAVQQYRIALRTIALEQQELRDLALTAQGPDGKSSGLIEGELVQKTRQSNEALNRRAAVVHAQIGRIYAAQGLVREALQEYRVAAELDRDSKAYKDVIALLAEPLPGELAPGESVVVEGVPPAKPGPGAAETPGGGAGGATKPPVKEPEKSASPGGAADPIRPPAPPAGKEPGEAAPPAKPPEKAAKEPEKAAAADMEQAMREARAKARLQAARRTHSALGGPIGAIARQ